MQLFVSTSEISPHRVPEKSGTYNAAAANFFSHDCNHRFLNLPGQANTEARKKVLSLLHYFKGIRYTPSGIHIIEPTTWGDIDFHSFNHTETCLKLIDPQATMQVWQNIFVVWREKILYSIFQQGKYRVIRNPLSQHQKVMAPCRGHDK